MANKTSALKRLLTHNAELKILAIVLAVMSFYAIRRATSSEKTYEIPLEVRVAEDSQVAVLDAPSTVSVMVRGSHEDLLRLDATQLRAVVYPKASDPSGSEVLGIAPKNIEGARSVRVVQIDPAVVTVNFDTEVALTFSVARPEVRGTPLVGKAEIEYEPKTVLVRGPKKRLQGKSVVKTKWIDVEGRGQSFSQRVEVLPPENTRVSAITPSEVTVKVNIAWETISREWSNVVVNAVMPAGTIRPMLFEPATVDVSLHGRPELIKGLADNMVRAIVHCPTSPPAVGITLPVCLHLPVGMDVTVTLRPDTVNVVASPVVEDAKSVPARESKPTPETQAPKGREDQTGEGS